MALIINIEKHLKVELWTDKKKHVTQSGEARTNARGSKRSSAPASPQRVFPKATHYSCIQFFPFGHRSRRQGETGERWGLQFVLQ